MTDEPATDRPDGPGDESDAPLDLDTATQRALLALPGRSPAASVCPFLRAAVDQPPDPGASEHHCVALSPIVLVNQRQRVLACEHAAHLACPRYTRGEAAVRAALAPAIGKRSRAVPVAIGSAAILLVLVAAVVASNGLATPIGGSANGPGVPTDSSGADDGGGAGASPEASGATTADPLASRTGPGVSLPSPTVEPRATVRPTLVATELPVAWRGLQSCSAPDTCYLYVVKRGDTFGAIAARFATTTKKLRRLNPAIVDPGTIRVGSEVRVPPPPS